MNYLKCDALIHTSASPSVRVQPIPRPALAAIGTNVIDTELFTVI